MEHVFRYLRLHHICINFHADLIHFVPIPNAGAQACRELASSFKLFQKKRSLLVPHGVQKGAKGPHKSPVHGESLPNK